ncbi:MAG TPA: hypothetical protein VFN56_01180 [Candidatus Saccharimonadales bacterium]|nr:hypothetical protein [Candidatus Saccharimonadales bacterium]
MPYLLKQQFLINPPCTVFAAVFRTLAVNIATVFGAVKGNRVAAGFAFSGLEQEWLRIVLGFAIGTSIFNLLHLFPKPVLNYFWIVVVIELALFTHLPHIKRIVQYLLPL